jgi:FkbM family methyltransferase
MSFLRTIKFIVNHPLNNEDKLKSIIPFANWQICSRLFSGEMVYDWINGAKFRVRKGETGLTGNIYTGLHEFADMGFLLHFLREEDLFVDIGANAGSYTILAGSAVGASGIAFEPVPSTFKRFVENIRLNYLDDRVLPINKGVGAEKGKLVFTSNCDTTNHALALDERCDNTIAVEVTTLDDSLQGKSPALIKIDVEGYETLVLAGAQKTLKNESLKAIIMELNGSGQRYGYDESKIIELMFNYGFRTYSYNPLTRTLINLEGQNIHSGNTLFLRDIFFIEEKLKNAPSFFVHERQF